MRLLDLLENGVNRSKCKGNFEVQAERIAKM